MKMHTLSHLILIFVVNRKDPEKKHTASVSEFDSYTNFTESFLPTAAL